jgi:signal transduction histidine kinase
MSGQPVSGIFEMNIVCKDKREVTVELTGAFTSYQGKRANVIYLRDITQRKILEGKLDIERNRYRTLFEDVPVAIWEIDYSETKRAIDKLRAKGIVDLREYLLVHQEEFEKYFYFQKVLGVNKACNKLWEADSIEQLFEGLYPVLKQRKARWARDIENIVLFSEGHIRINYDSIEPTLKGNSKHVHIEYCIAPGYEDTWGRVFCSFFDITDRKKAEEGLKRYQDNLEMLVNQRSLELKEAGEKLRQLLGTERALRQNIQKQMEERIEFTRALVHELKTPLTPLIACSESLLSTVNEEPQLSFARNIHIGANKLIRKVDELLDLSRGEIGLLTLNKRKISVLKLLRETVGYVYPTAVKNDIALTLRVLQKLPAIEIDRDRMQQVLLNLLDNAIKYTPAKGEIFVLASLDNSFLRVEVKDNGIGIDEEKQKYLFQPYKRLHMAKTHVGGLGLGLVLAKMIVELHEGKITVRSKKGIGSSFIITLPIMYERRKKSREISDN